MNARAIPYGDREVRPVHVAGAASITTPVAGFYRTKLRSGGVLVGIRLWHGAPHDPVTGDELDRSWRWQAECNGELIDFDRVWPACAGDPIGAAEYEYLSSLQAWGREHSPGSPEANPHKAVNWLTAPLTI